MTNRPQPKMKSDIRVTRKQYRTLGWQYVRPTGKPDDIVNAGTRDIR